VSFDHSADLADLGDSYLPKPFQGFERSAPVTQGAERDLRDDEWMHDNSTACYKRGHLRVGAAKMINPN
jgi:hypothetical protein